MTTTYNYGNSSTSFGNRRFNRLVISKHQSASAQYAQCELSNWIIETVEWTAQDVANYYSSTKSNY